MTLPLKPSFLPLKTVVFGSAGRAEPLNSHPETVRRSTMGEAKRFSVSEACGRLTFNRRLDQRNRDAHARFKMMKVRSIDRSAIDRRIRDVHARQDDQLETFMHVPR